MSRPHSKFRIGLVQMSCSLDADQNLHKALTRIREAANQGAQIICLQELFRSQYFCREENHAFFDLAESIPGPSTEAIGSVARECGAVRVSGSVAKNSPYRNIGAASSGTQATGTG